MGSDKKKIAIIGLSSLLLVAMVIGVTLSVTKNKNDVADASASTSGSTISSTTKTVEALCSHTDYKETCKKTLAKANITNPKDLIKLAFEATIHNIGEALKNSSLLQKASSDVRTQGAFKVCEEVLENAIEDIQRSLDKIQSFDATKLNKYINDVETWLSGSLTHQDTCVDAFNNTKGDTGEQMAKITKTAREMSSNGLAIIENLASVFSALQIGGFSLGSPNSRRLMESEVPSFVDNHARKLMTANLKPNAVVALDGSGQFKTIKEAIDTIPKKNNVTFVVYIKEGVYHEHVMIPKKVNNVVLIGDGPLKTRISGNKSYADGTPTFHTPTVVVNGENFFAKDIGFENTAGPEGHQAVALRVSGDKAIFYNVRMDGFQDTLYVHTYRQFYTNCTITGTIDFVFGDSLAIFQDCRFVVRKPLENQNCMVTAQGRKDRRGIGAIVIQHSDIVADPAYTDAQGELDVQSYLGRPWKEYSRTIIMQTNIGAFIAPEGWSPWMGTFALDTCYYGEYQNRGAGASMTDRVKWKGIKEITPEIASGFTPGTIYQGDVWITASGVPYTPGMF